MAQRVSTSLLATLVFSLVAFAQSPNLSVTIMADATPVATGTPIGFTITVGNSSAAGTGIAVNVVLTDPLPVGPGLSWSISPAYGGPGMCSITGSAPQIMNCAVGNLAPGATATVHVQSPTTAPPGSSAGSYGNAPFATADNEPTPHGAVATIVVLPPPPPNLSVTIMADATPVATGTPIGFTITVGNSSAAGTGTAFNVVLTDPLPVGPGLSWSISPAYGGPGMCSITGSAPQIMNCTVGNLAPGATATVHVQSPTTAPPGSSAGSYGNAPFATADNEPTPHGAVATIVVLPPPPPNLSVTIMADATPVATGTPIGFTITVGNSSAAGTGTAFNVVLTDPLPVGPGLSWSISPAYGGPGMCSITGSAPQIMNCAVGNLAPGATATVHVQSPTTAPPGSSAGSYGNAPFATADNEPTPHGSVATIVVNPPPPPNLNIKKTADATPVPTGTTIGYTITVGNSSAAGTGIAVNVQLTDGLPGGPGLNWMATPPFGGPGTCAVSGTPPSQTLNCSFGNLAPGATATVHVQSPTTAPPGSSAGSYGNAALATADNETAGVFAVATIVVLPPPPTVTKTFGAATIPLNGSTSASFTVTNPNGTPMTGISFSDALPSGLVVSTPNGLSTTCLGLITASAGSNLISFSGGTLAANGSCSFSVNVTGIASGTQNNTTGPISSNESGPTTTTSNTASLIVISPPTITKAFGAVAIPVGGSSSLSFTITNPNATASLTVSFTDALPAGLVVSTPSGAVTTCLGGTLTANPGTNSISLSGAVIAATASCTITVDVTGVSAGVQNNTTGPVSSIEGGNGAPALASIFVGPAFQVRYTSNLSLGDGVINITNTGATGASLFGPGFGANVGNICVNVYAFSPDEQLISCCSCLVTPNGLASLSVVNDLTSNTLTGVRPGSIAVKLLSTVAGTGGSATDCTNSASTAVTTATLADGLAAWGTSVHPSPTGTAVTETAFTPSTLSFGEAASVAARCTNIIGNGSTFGICRACRSGGLGAAKQ